VGAAMSYNLHTAVSGVHYWRLIVALDPI